MASDREPCSIFENLPPEIKGLIWSHVPKDELQLLRHVSRCWKRSIENTFGIAVVVSQENWPHTWLLDSGGITEITFSSYTSRFSPALFVLDNLRSVTFHRILLKNNLLGILQHFGHLESLSFSKVIIDQETAILTPYPIQLPRLRTLQIQTTGEIPISTTDEILLCLLAESSYGALRTFRYWCPNELLKRFHLNVLFNGGLGSTDWFVEIIQKNRMTIRTLVLGSVHQPFTFEFLQRRADITDHTPMQIKEITGGHDVPGSWDLLLRSQHYLEKIGLSRNAFTQWDAAYRGISESRNTLKAVSLTGGGHPFTRINLDCFNKCGRLEYLKLRFQIHGMDNLNLLPRSLRVLKLWGPLTKFQLAGLNELRNLSTLFLDNKETEEDARERTSRPDLSVDQNFIRTTLDVPIFRELVAMPRLESMFLSNLVMKYEGIAAWLQSQDVADYVSGVYMKALNRDKTLGSIALEMNVDRKGRLSSLV